MPGGGVAYGNGLTTDSLLAIAKAHVDSALVHTGNNDSIAALAYVGLARAWINRGQYDSAA